MSYMFKSLSHFEFIFVYGERVCSKFIDLYVAVQWAKNIFKEVISKDMDSKMDEEENGDERMITNNSF